jgi:O-antigen/teichoic acid export membrane protein
LNEQRLKNFKNLTFMLVGNFGAQLVSLLFYPVLVRIYKPEDFGIFGTFSSFMVIAAIFASGQLQMAFIKCREKEELNNLLWVFRVYAIWGVIISSLIVFIVNIKFSYFSTSLLVLFPFSLVSYLSFESNKMLAISLENFKIFSGVNAINRVGSNIFKLLMGSLSATTNSLVFSELLTNLFSSLTLTKKLKTKAIKPTAPWELIKKYRHFPIFASLSNFFQLGLLEFPVLILAIYYSKYEIGLYVLSLRLILQPMAVIGNSIASIASKKMVNNHAEKNSNILILLKIYGFYLTIGVLVFLTTYSIPATWFHFVLGKNWNGIQEVLIPITILTTAKLSSGLHIYFYIAADAIKIKTVWKAIQLSTLVFLIIVNHHFSFNELLWLICIVEAVIDLMFTIYTVFIQTRVSKK